MKKLLPTFCLSLLLGGFLSLSGYGQTTPTRHKTLLVFFDGLRPDYITSELMPNLFAFKQKASVGQRHHSVFPTVTRVNSASYATGSYPGTHGILGNSVYFPQVNKTKSVGTTYGDLTKIAGAIDGPLLTAVSLGEVLQSAGERMMVFSSGTTGQAYLQNYTVSGGAIINPDLILPESFKPQVLADLGAVATAGEEDENRHAWITDAYLKYGLDAQGPLVSAIWYSDPDGAAHSHGIGSPEAVRAIHFVDAQFGRILEALKARELSDSINILISADHGFVTHVGKQNLTDFLIAQRLKKDKESDDVVVAEGAIYVKDHEPEAIKKIVAALQKEEWMGAIFTQARPDDAIQGWVDGTLSFATIHYNHPTRVGDILVAPNWNDDKNAQGYAGTDFSGGVAGHGGSSPYEINIALLARGPDFKASVAGTLPTSNVDLAPTILSIYDLPVPATMEGRVMGEFLKKKTPSAGKLVQETRKTEVTYPWGTYTLTLQRSVLGPYQYVDYTRVERKLGK
ncbi:alkaline phosphatase family protein [Salmonirosea aquatica]|uniref:Alkaline phosphatase family protein n=1 Tax=Salmonirosea aquatica TaxID=2654236 RepID=A0A7C9BKG4_9BACT|nr:alkaline phosphatase family protein [Cytophagaceae bacterium SJW1-29]